MRYLITGGCGFLGSNLASEVMKRGEELFVFDNLYRVGSEKNLEWLKTQGKFTFIRGDIRNASDVQNVVEKVRPEVVFHVAGQVAMTTSLERPYLDFEINALGTFHLLEALKKNSPDAILLYSSTNKVYGDLEYLDYEENESRYLLKNYPHGIPESVQLDFRTPYGCSKGAADQYVKDAFNCFGLKTVVFRHSSIYGGRQYSTVDQGWIGWFVQQALDLKKGKNKDLFTISGNGKQVRDVLYADDLISCYFQAVDHISNAKGAVYNIGGGMNNSLSLLELFKLLEQELGIQMKFKSLPARSSDQKVFVADISKAQNDFKWKPKVDRLTGLKKMIQWVDSL